VGHARKSYVKMSGDLIAVTGQGGYENMP